MLRETVAQWRNVNQTVALVPTMGALHKGHISLINTARKQAQKVIVSIFVNPMQFGPHEDFSRYPRSLEQDRDMLANAGVDVLYAPDLIEMYPQGFATSVNMKGPALANLEDAFRPTHFQGVATVVSKLLLQSLPNYGVFGEKDYQQLLVIKRLVADLDIPVQIIASETARMPNGLALSSRNQYLSMTERNQAPLLFDVLYNTACMIKRGMSVQQALSGGKRELQNIGFDLDYLEARHTQTLAPTHNTQEPLVLLAAARLGQTRLIDNLMLERVNPDQPPSSLIKSM